MSRHFTPPIFSRSISNALALVALAIACGACTPTFDWRAVTNDAAGFAVSLPAKPTLDERTIQIAGHALTMTMQAAKTNDVVFAVGVVTLPGEDPALQAAVLKFLEDGLARNVSSVPVTEPVQIRLSDPEQRIAGVAMNADGTVAGNKTRRVVHARFAVRGRHVYQAVVVAEKEPAAEQIDQFFDSLRLY
jgi:hypothetical protein